MLEKKVDFEAALTRLREFEWTFTATLKGKEVPRSPEAFFATVYGAYLCSENSLGSAEAFEGYLDNMDDERRYLFIKDKTKNNFSILPSVQKKSVSVPLGTSLFFKESGL